MGALVKFEYRKLWNKVSVVTVIAMFVISSLHTFIYLDLNSQWRAIDKDGEIVSGLAAYRALKEASKDIEGVMDGKYLKSLKDKYELSTDRKYLDEHRGFLGTGGMTKYMYPNYFVNYAYYSYYMSNGNDKIGIDYDFLDSEERFYKKYREAVREQLLYENKYAGLLKFTKQQLEVLDKKIAEISTPVKVAYCQGISNFMNWFNLEYPVFYVVLAFTLACTYAKDSLSGVSEISLSAANGRKKDFRARWIAGNLFAASVYLIFIGVLLAEHGAAATFSGFGASAQTYWFNCIFNINIGTGMVLKIAGGLLGALVFANFTMLMSCVFKNIKPASAVSVLAALALTKLSGIYSQIKLLYPLQFSTDAVLKDFFFFGKILIPYAAVVMLLTIAYIGLFGFCLGRMNRKYYLN